MSSSQCLNAINSSDRLDSWTQSLVDIDTRMIIHYSITGAILSHHYSLSNVLEQTTRARLT